MSHAPPSFQASDPVRVRVHALERVHTDPPGFSRLQSVNLSGATGLIIRVTNPESGISSDLGSPSIDDAAGGIFGADANPGQLSSLGPWKAQGKFTLGGSARSTRVGVFIAEDNLPAPP